MVEICQSISSYPTYVPQPLRQGQSYCSCQYIPVWQQDIGNQYLLNREIETWGHLVNYLYPQPPQTSQTHILSTNTRNCLMPITNNSEIIDQSRHDLRNIDIESHLFLVSQHLRVDGCDHIPIDPTTRRISNQQLYRAYHAHEVHSPCYPDMDRSQWDNVTKAINHSVDTRH